MTPSAAAGAASVADDTFASVVAEELLTKGDDETTSSIGDVGLARPDEEGVGRSPTSVTVVGSGAPTVVGTLTPPTAVPRSSTTTRRRRHRPRRVIRGSIDRTERLARSQV
jgi:hypothetical protein